MTNPPTEVELEQWETFMSTTGRWGTSPNGADIHRLIAGYRRARERLNPNCDEAGCLLQGLAHDHVDGVPHCRECAQPLLRSPEEVSQC